MSISESLLTEFKREMDNTRKMLAAAPDGKWDWKPHPKSMTLGQLTGHLADMASWAVDTIEKDSLAFSSGDFKPYVPASSQDLMAVFDTKREQAQSAIAKASDSAMDQVWTMTWDGQKIIESPRTAVIRDMVVNHIIHHRGQLSVYLRLLDQKVPGVYGPSADEMS